MYSDLYFRQKKSYFPLIAAIVAVVAVTSFVSFYFSSHSTPTRASKKVLVQREVVNVTSTQAGIFWQTDDNETGWIIYGSDPTKLSFTASDERDSSNKNAYVLHYAILKNLKPNTNYYYRIVSNRELISEADNSPFVVKTADSLGASSNAQPAYGKVALKTGAPADNTFVIVRINNAYPLLAKTKMTGEWLIPMQFVIGKTDNAPVSLKGTDTVQIDVINEDLQKTKITALVNKISPLPQTVVLGNNYRFIEDQSVLSAYTTNTQSQPTNGVDILFPKQNGVIPGSKPLIKGTALPGADVELELNSQPKFLFSTQANDRGEWIINVPRPLQPREYTLVLTSKNQTNQLVTITRTFTIAKSGEQVLGEATAEATPTTAPTTAVSPTVQPTTAVATTVPTKVPEATQSATPSAIPTTAYVTPSITPALPVSGGNGFFYTLASIGLLVVGAGVFIFL